MILFYGHILGGDFFLTRLARNGDYFEIITQPGLHVWTYVDRYVQIGRITLWMGRFKIIKHHSTLAING